MKNYIMVIIYKDGYKDFRYHRSKKEAEAEKIYYMRCHAVKSLYLFKKIGGFNIGY